MELNNLFVKHRIPDSALFCLAVLIWLTALYLFDSAFFPTTTAKHITVLAVAAGSALAIFKIFENVPAFKLIQKPSEAFFLTCAFVMGTVCLNVLFAVIESRSTNWLPLEIEVPLLACMTFVCYGYTLYFLLQYNRKRNVALYLDGGETEFLKTLLKFPEKHTFVNFLSKKDLKEHILRQELKSIDLIIISRETVKKFDAEAVLIRAHLAGVPIIDIKDVSCKCAGRIDIDETDLSTYLLGATQKTLSARLLLKLRYFTEPIAAALMLIVSLPIASAVALAIKLTSPGPVLYAQNRTGLNGKQFTLLKFRSMTMDAESTGPQWCSRADGRITKLGNFLRRTRLDELPQLWNIMKGEMSFIGPRPERPEMYKLLENEVPLFSLRTLVRPGITGWAQINSGYASTVAESLLKLEYDLFYIQHMSLRFDLLILLKTVKVALSGDTPPDKSMLKPVGQKKPVPELSAFTSSYNFGGVTNDTHYSASH